MPYRTLDLEQAARYLHLERAEVEKLVKDQEIPFERHGGKLLFRKLEIDSWASPRILGLQGRRLAEYHRKSSRAAEGFIAGKELLPQLLRPEFINPALTARTKASLIREMAALAKSTGLVCDPESLLQGLRAREELCSTGLPGGLAVLHTRQAEDYLFESPFIVLGRTVQEIPFGAPDGRPTDLFFLLACPEEQLHLHALARLCVLAEKTGLLPVLRGAADSADMCRCLFEAEREVLAA